MELKQLNLIDVLSDYGVVLTKKGKEYWASCPFHEDRDPSFSVSDNMWYCFSCKRGGGVVEFVAQMENVPNGTATSILAGKYDLTVNMNPIKKFYTDLMEILKVESHPYLEGRGITSMAIKAHNIGYCEDMGPVLEQMQVDRQSAIDMGLPDISRCIVYPFYDHEGCYKLAVRTIDQKSYKGSAKTSVWKHGLWGIERIRSKKVYIFEGYHDVMVATDHGIPAVAMCGTNMQPEFWAQLKYNGVEEVTFVPDGDYGGRSFMERLIGTYDTSFDVRFVDIGAGDPDDAILSEAYLNWEPMLPLQWYVSSKWNPQDLGDKIKMYRDIAKYYSRMRRWEQELFHKWFEDQYGAEGLDYLSGTIEPDRKSERTVIANCLYSENIRLESLQVLSEDDFSTNSNRSLFEFIKHHQATPILIQTNFDVDLSDSVDLINYKVYIERVRESSIKTRFINEIDKARVQIGGTSPETVAGELSSKLIKIVENKEYVYESSDLIKKVMSDISDKVKNPRVLGISMDENYFPITNRSLMGFVPKKFILVSGPTGHGKTTTVLNWLDDLIFNKNEEVIFFSLEMTPEEIIEKMIAIHTGIAGTKIMTGSLEQSEYDEIMSVAKVLISSKLKIIYGVYDLYKIINIAKSMLVKSRAKVMVLDYLQLIQMNDRSDRWQQLMMITNNIKRQICNQFDATFIGISQLSKASLNSGLAEAKDQSGSYGMLADVDVALTIRQKTTKEMSDGTNFEIYIDKHRYGRDKVLIPALFDKGTQRIREVM